MSATSSPNPGGFGDPLLDIIQRDYSARRSPAKAIARDGNVSPKTGSNWLRMVCTLRCNELLQLMAANRALTAELNLRDRGGAAMPSFLLEIGWFGFGQARSDHLICYDASSRGSRHDRQTEA